MINKIFKKCPVCKKTKWFFTIQTRWYNTKHAGIVKGQSKCCGKCFKDMKNHLIYM